MDGWIKDNFYHPWLFKGWQKRYQENNFIQPFKSGEWLKTSPLPQPTSFSVVIFSLCLIDTVFVLSLRQSWAVIIGAGRMGAVVPWLTHYWLLLKFNTLPPPAFLLDGRSPSMLASLLSRESEPSSPEPGWIGQTFSVKLVNIFWLWSPNILQILYIIYRYICNIYLYILYIYMYTYMWGLPWCLRW